MSDEEVDILSIDEENQKDNVKLMKELAWKIDTGRKAGAYPRAAKRNALKTQTMKQKCDTKTSENKIKKQTKERHAKLEVNCSNKESHSSTSDGDLAINVEAFVNHAPIVEDVDQASSSCPVCSVLCDDVVQHIKDFHDSGEMTVWTLLMTATLFSVKLKSITTLKSFFYADFPLKQKPRMA